jgi:hypothetical protein
VLAAFVNGVECADELMALEVLANLRAKCEGLGVDWPRVERAALDSHGRE